jgi:hypothetical protein
LIAALDRGAALLSLVVVLAAACGDGDSSLETPQGGSPVASVVALRPAQGGGRVLYVAPAGDDAAEGSAEHPWRTLQHAADAVLPGDTVMVKQGTYGEEVTLAAPSPSRAAPRTCGWRASG